LDVDKRLRTAVQSYWDARRKNKEKQVESGRIDAGTRGEVTGGTQMGALEVLVSDILCEAGLKNLMYARELRLNCRVISEPQKSGI
jgi:hypothetical protein